MNPVQPQAAFAFPPADVAGGSSSAVPSTPGRAAVALASGGADSVGNMWYPRSPVPKPAPACPAPKSFSDIMDGLMQQLQAMLGRLAGGFPHAGGGYGGPGVGGGQGPMPPTVGPLTTVSASSATQQ